MVPVHEIEARVYVDPASVSREHKVLPMITDENTKGLVDIGPAQAGTKYPVVLQEGQFSDVVSLYRERFGVRYGVSGQGMGMQQQQHGQQMMIKQGMMGMPGMQMHMAPGMGMMGPPRGMMSGQPVCIFHVCKEM